MNQINKEYIQPQKRWDKKFESKINVVLGNEWLAGNLSYHLKSRPRWEAGIENYLLTGDKMCFRTNVCLGDK